MVIAGCIGTDRATRRWSTRGAVRDIGGGACHRVQAAARTGPHRKIQSVTPIAEPSSTEGYRCAGGLWVCESAVTAAPGCSPLPGTAWIAVAGTWPGGDRTPDRHWIRLTARPVSR